MAFRDKYWTLSLFFCRLEELPTPTKKLPPDSTPYVLFTGFEPLQAQQYIKVTKPMHASCRQWRHCQISDLRSAIKSLLCAVCYKAAGKL